MKIGIIGTGAIGGYYGSKLALGSNEVHFLLNSDYDFVTENGLKVISNKGDIVLPKVNAWNSTADMPKCDLIIICLKTTENHLLKELLPPITHQNSTFLSLQNGFNPDKEIKGMFPKHSIFGGLCRIGANKIGPGLIKHINYETILLGESQSNQKVMTLKALSQLFFEAGIEIEPHNNILEARWRKLCWNIPFNGLATTLCQNTNEIVKSPGYRKLAKEIILEVIQIAKVDKIKIEPAFADQMLALTDNLGSYKPSMMLDHEASRPLEISQIYEEPIKLALANNCKIPRIQKLHSELKSL